jgi:hypothetical protein
VAPLKAETAAGEMELIVGAGFTRSTARIRGVEVPPPGAGVVTDTARLAGFANCAAGATAVNNVRFTYSVGSAVPPNSTTDCTQKPVPVTVSVVFPLPSLTVAGEMLLTAGAGFTMVTDAPADCPELAAVTVTVFVEGGIPGAV